jgi:DNA uptake protein ComE-like DNA-binding protein
LGHRASVNLRLAKYQKERLKAAYLAKAGINKAIAILQEDKNNPQTSGYDSLNETWSTGRDLLGNHILENIQIKEGYGGTFTVRFLYNKETNEYRCISDEERRININVIDPPQVLVKLFEFAEIENPEELKNLMLKWLNADTNEAEDAQHIFKNESLRTPEELLLILEYFYRLNEGKDNSQQKAKEAYEKMKDIITVFTDGKININTASQNVLLILARAGSDNEGLIRSLVGKIIQFRESSNGPFKEDTEIGNFYQDLSSQEKQIFDMMRGMLKVGSSYFRIESMGNLGSASKKITAIYNREEKKVYYWHEN